MEFIYPKETEELLQKIKENQSIYSKMDSRYAKAIHQELDKMEVKVMELSIPMMIIKKEIQ